ncbi:MAG TPA: MATE family efflux transporter [Bacteroidetes bacterium]|nr:MATE family efflux transporter [Bacteroidota bacterium]
MIDYDNIKPAHRVVINSSILYVKMIISVIIVFFSTRLVLGALGADDYGLYNLVAGVIAMLSFLKSAIAGSTQRYLSYYQGKNDLELQKKIFINSVYLHIAIGVGLVIILETVGLFLFDIEGLLRIDPDKIWEAKTIYHFMSATMFFTILSVPFSGTMNAHENLLGIAIIELIEVVLRLAIALALFFLVKSGKLIFYGLLTASITVVTCIISAIYCKIKYPECESFFDKKYVQLPLLKELSSFAGWTLMGSFSGVAKSQGIAIVLNHFMGTIANAAYGITNQVVGQLNYFTTTMFRAFNPQIMKTEGADQREKMVHLSMIGCKFGFFLLAFIAIPCLFEMPALLDIWLKEVPDYTVMFCTMVLIATMVTQLTAGMQSAIMASGRIKRYMILVSSTKLLTLPTAYFLMKAGYQVICVFWGYIFFEAIAGIVILYLSKIEVNLKINLFIKRVLLKESIPVLLTAIFCYALTKTINFELRWLITIPSGMIFFVIMAYLAGLCEDEKEIIDSMIKKFIKKG